MFELTLTQLISGLVVFIVVQGIGIVEGYKKGDVLFYYIPATIIASVAFWAALVFGPEVI